MSMTEKTPNVELPLGKGSDIFSLFDINAINTKLDLLIKALQDKDLLHDEEITAIKSNNNTVANTLQAHGDSILAHSTAINNIVSDVNKNKSDVDVLLREYSDLNDVVLNFSNLKNGVAMDMSSINGNNNVSVATGERTSVAQITLERGKWIIIATAVFNFNSNGFREILITSSANASAGTLIQRTNAVNGSNTILSGVYILENESDDFTSRYLTVHQSSGSNINVTPVTFRAIRIG